MLKVEPLPGIIYIETEQVKVGSFDTSSKESAVEFAEVLAVGEGVAKLQAGDKIFVKSWAIDLINHEGKWYKFVNMDTGGVVAKITDEGV